LIKKSHFMWIWKLCFFLVLDWTMHWSYLETTFLVAIIYQIKHLPWIENLFGYHFCLFPSFFTFYYHILSNIHKNTKLKLQPFFILYQRSAYQARRICSSLQMREPPRLSLMGTCFSVLIRIELTRLRDQIIPLWMYPSGADAGSEAIVNQKQHQPSRPRGPAAPIQNGLASTSTSSVEQQASAAKPYIALLQ